MEVRNRRSDFKRHGKAQGLTKGGDIVPQWKQRMQKSFLDAARRKRETILAKKRAELNSDGFGCVAPGSLELHIDAAKAATTEVNASLRDLTMQIMDQQHEGAARGTALMECDEEALWDDDTPVRDLSEEEHAEMMAQLEVDLLHDLEQEEEALVAVAEAQALEAEASAQHDVEGYYQDVSGQRNGAVLCPVCKHDDLHFAEAQIGCPCGIRINTETDYVHPDYVQQQLADALAQHSQCCPSQPFFCVQNTFGMEGLYMLCNDCDALELII